ncbi:hypothetical protein [Ruegeria sp. HKCCC2117]|uniref:hypothetical protein n=1 Tax=Ruegeria sp. HKCCC2117 TaxID=2682992 RepID=UPI001488DF0A|nr:hypothetical protein [Ruegeria sp. HKCCC2117]
MGRKSAVNETASKLEMMSNVTKIPVPPHDYDFTPEEQAHWDRLILARAPFDWTPVDLAVLATLCQNMAMRNELWDIANQEPLEETKGGTTKPAGALQAANTIDSLIMSKIRMLKLTSQVDQRTLDQRADAFRDAKQIDGMSKSNGLLAD